MKESAVAVMNEMEGYIPNRSEKGRLLRLLDDKVNYGMNSSDDEVNDYITIH